MNTNLPTSTLNAQHSPSAPRVRTGKIARLSHALREQLNLRLQNGEPGQHLVSWLNSLPEVQTLLAADFDAQPVNEQNLSAWRQGGFEDWRRHQEARALARTLAEESQDLTNDSNHIALADHLSAPLALALARIFRDVADTDAPPAERSATLLAVARELAILRRCDQEAARLHLERERWATQLADRADKKKAQADFAPFQNLLMSSLLGTPDRDLDRSKKHTKTTPSAPTQSALPLSDQA